MAKRVPGGLALEAIEGKVDSLGDCSAEKGGPLLWVVHVGEREL
jgi:hypothetical protein